MNPATAGSAAQPVSAHAPALLAAASLAAALLLPPPATAQFVAPEGSNFHNGSTLPLQDEGEAREQLHQLQGALERQDGNEAAAILRGLRADHRPLLVPLGPRTDLPALELAARMVARSEAGAVRDRIEREARADIAEARRTRDLDRLIDHATRGTALASAREAGLLAARLLCEQGEFWQAGSLATRAGDLPGAAEVAAAARAATARTASATNGAAPAAAGAPAGTHWLLQCALSLLMEDDPDLAGLPLITDGRDGEVLVLDGRGIWLVDPRTASASATPFTWVGHVPRRSTGEVLAPAPRRHTLARAGQRLLVPFEVPQRAQRGPGTARRGLLLALDLLPPAPVPAAPAAGAPPPLPEALRMAWIGELPAHEAANAAGGAGGSDPDAEEEEESSTTLGPPLVVGERVFVQVFRTGLTTEVSLACFALADGRLLFDTPLVAGSQVQRFSSRLAEISERDLDKRAREGPPAERDGIVWACTGFGVVAAVDGLTGLPRHTFRYDRLFSEDADTWDPAFLFDTEGWDDEPVRLRGDRVVVAPGDSRFLYMLATEPGPRGDQILDDPIERMDRRFIVDLLPDPQGRPSPAVLATRRRASRDGLVLLGPDGHTLDSSPWLDEASFATGRPLLVGSAAAAQVLLPTVAGLLDQPRDDLAAQPQVVPQHATAPAAVIAVFPLRDGFATLSSLPPQSTAQPKWSWLIQCYRPAP